MSMAWQDGCAHVPTARALRVVADDDGPAWRPDPATETGLLWLTIGGALHRLRFWTAAAWERAPATDRPPATMMGEYGGRWMIEPWVSGPTAALPAPPRPEARPA